MNQRNLSWGEYSQICDFAESKFSYMDNEELRNQAVFDFIDAYVNGGKIAVFNDRNQFLDHFDTLDDAIRYIEENEPKNELWTIDVEQF